MQAIICKDEKEIERKLGNKTQAVTLLFPNWCVYLGLKYAAVDYEDLCV